MPKRAKVLRDPYLGPGILMVEGRQYLFLMNGTWKSEVPAKPGLLVDVEFDGGGKITAITALTESQLASERANAEVKTGRDNGVLPLSSAAIAEHGRFHLFAAALLVGSWFFLTAVSVQWTLFGRVQLTFWEVLGWLNSGSEFPNVIGGARLGPGLYAFVAGVAIAGPLLPGLLKQKAFLWAGQLPMIFMIAVGLLAHNSIHNLAAGIAPSTHSGVQETIKGVTLGLGAYLSFLVALYFAVSSAKGIRRARMGNEGRIRELSKAAA